MAEHLTPQTDLSNFDIVIGCVDTLAARQLIASKVQGCQSRVAYYVDLGNSADCGQFVLGQPLNGRNRRSAERLRTAAELFPEIIEASLDGDGAPSCSTLEAIERQEPFVNQVLAYHALALLARLFRHGQIDYHGAFVGCAGKPRHTDHDKPGPLAKNATAWAAVDVGGGRLVLVVALVEVSAQQVAGFRCFLRVFLLENEPQTSRLFIDDLLLPLFRQGDHSNTSRYSAFSPASFSTLLSQRFFLWPRTTRPTNPRSVATLSRLRRKSSRVAWE